MVIVWLLLKLQVLAVLHVLAEFGRLTPTQLVEIGLNLLLLDGSILLIFIPTWEPLPGELSPNKVEQNMPDGLQIVPSTLLFTLVCCNRRIPCRTSQVLALSVWNVLPL